MTATVYLSAKAEHECVHMIVWVQVFMGECVPKVEGSQW